MSPSQQSSLTPILRDPVIKDEKGKDAFNWYYGDDAGGLILDFGIHRGLKMREAPFDYLYWCNDTFSKENRHPTFRVAFRKFYDGLEKYAETNAGDFVIPFKKHLGKTIKECALSGDRQYLEWLCEKNQQHLRDKYGPILFKAAENWLKTNKGVGSRKSYIPFFCCEACDDGYGPGYNYGYDMGFDDEYGEEYSGELEAAYESWLNEPGQREHRQMLQDLGLIPADNEEDESEEPSDSEDDDTDNGYYTDGVQDSGRSDLKHNNGDKSITLQTFNDSIVKSECNNEQAHNNFSSPKQPIQMTASIHQTESSSRTKTDSSNIHLVGNAAIRDQTEVKSELKTPDTTIEKDEPFDDHKPLLSCTCEIKGEPTSPSLESRQSHGTVRPRSPSAETDLLANQSPSKRVRTTASPSPRAKEESKGHL